MKNKTKFKLFILLLLLLSNIFLVFIIFNIDAIDNSETNLCIEYSKINDTKFNIGSYGEVQVLINDKWYNYDEVKETCYNIN